MSPSSPRTSLAEVEMNDLALRLRAHHGDAALAVAYGLWRKNEDRGWFRASRNALTAMVALGVSGAAE